MWAGLSQRLQGTLVILEPFESRHEEGLYEAANDAEIWRWMPVNAIESRETFHAWMEQALALGRSGEQAPFAILDAPTDQPIGSTRYLTLRPEHRGSRSATRGWPGLRGERAPTSTLRSRTTIGRPSEVLYSLEWQRRPKRLKKL